MHIHSPEYLPNPCAHIRIVPSGYHRFHIWIHDFKPQDWTYYSLRDPVKSHEVARRKYVEYLKRARALMQLLSALIVPQLQSPPHMVSAVKLNTTL
jgi:hypothetical protein